MLDREQQLLDAAMRYTTLLAGSEPVSIRDFVATVDADLRDELTAYLELYLVFAQPGEPIVSTPEEQALITRATARVQAWLQRELATDSPALTLSALRRARNLTPGALARQLNLPVDLWQRIERGGVQATSIPGKLVERLAGVLQQPAATIHVALTTSPQRAVVHLSAADATTIPAETAVDFAEALEASTATASQKAEWT